jgi:hypothetical protein
MIRAEVEGVDTSQYIYDTGLTFGSDLGHEVLDLALTQPDIFPQRHNYNRGDNPKELMTTWLARRKPASCIDARLK